MSDIINFSPDKESLNTRLTELQTKADQLELERSTANEKLKKINANTAISNPIFLEIEEIAKISAYFSDKEKFPEEAANFGAINKLATDKKTSLTGELNNWNTNNIDIQTQLDQEILNIDKELVPINQEIQEIQIELDSLKQREKVTEEKITIFNQTVAETVEFTSGIDKLNLTWKVEEADDYDNTDQGFNDFVGELKITLIFGKMKSDELDLTFWYLQKTHISRSQSGALQIAADVSSTNTGDPKKGVDGLAINVTIQLKLSVNPLQVQEEGSTTEHDSWQIIPEIGVEAKGVAVNFGGIGKTWGSSDTTVRNKSQGGSNADFTRTLEYTFVNTGSNLICKNPKENQVSISLEEWSKGIVVNNALKNNGLYDKDSEILVLTQNLDSSKLKAGI